MFAGGGPGGILTKKNVNLSSAGTKYTDLYYYERNSSVEEYESTCLSNTRKTLSSKDFGGNTEIKLPMNCFVGLCMLHLTLPPLVANQCLSEGWGLRMINNIKYQFGSQGSTPIVIQNAALFTHIMTQCETQEKRRATLRLCGDRLAAPGNVGVVPEAYVPILLPFSAICDRLMYDATMLGQPISITVTFESDPSFIYGGTGTKPDSFAIAELIVRTQVLTNPSISLSTVMENNPGYKYVYPYIMPLSFKINPAITGSTSGEKVSVSLNSFQNSDILSIAFFVIKNSYLKPGTNLPPNPYAIDPIRDIVMTYNGGMFFDYPGISNTAASCYLGNQQSPYYDLAIFTAASTTTNFIAEAIAPALTIFDFTLLRASCISEHMNNTTRVPPGGVLDISFFTSTTDSYTAYYTIFYNAAAITHDGVCDIIVS